MLKEQIIQDMTAAMKAKDELPLSVLRMLKADIMKYEVSGKDMVATDDVVMGIIKRSVKQRKEAAEGFQKGGNTEAADKELEEMKILEKYLPEQMSEDQVKAIVQETIDQLGVGPADFGKVMGAVMGKTKGQADGGMVNKLVKELLG
ncbi:GatB/YqeY domain-containing protein [Patescibacteria group bacterium]|nr:GatB/YqeY domain-containing protein [Patescibacteria group bacterium]MBU1682360.1 GatB/YqeY domain-containing protein [Patescibacteria group bacterium]MBU1935048.1 GatB/YqeY domain-containing protein [Patescibacteria group bacterium]